jgi:hypothetical protein
MERLKYIIDNCKAGVYLDINSHKDNYESVENYIETMKTVLEDFVEDVGQDIISEMIKRDIVVNLTFYPNTPIGKYDIYHYDLDKALDLGVKIIKNN